MRLKIFSFLLTGLFSLALLPAGAAAETAIQKAKNKLGAVGIKTGLTTEAAKNDGDIYTRLASYLNVILGLIGILATIYIIYAGIKWIRAGGNEQEVTAAKETIRSAIFGLIVVFGSYAIVNFVILKLIGSI